jgi:Zn-dependent protease with chaperone function
MDFFQSQEVARRKTGRLVLFFVLAVIAIIASVHLLAVGIFAILSNQAENPPALAQVALDPRLIGAVAGLTLLLIVGAAMAKIAELSRGGAVVAESLGGRLLEHDNATQDESRLLNVVEEMSIASGLPTPQVYLLDKEQSINAFAAGYTPADAAVGVTRGCVEQLSRDELQGVIAHEFSHILNGDMRLNIRLIGMLQGIMVLGIVGYYMLRMARFSGVRSSGRSGKGNSTPAVMMLGGLGLMVVGSVGTFFGTLIKSAVSRQREFLADASAVQFTRNPSGIADALKRIGGLSAHAEIEHPNAPQASHMFFGQAVTVGFNALFATHPPLPERIRRIEPGWDGKFLPARTSARFAEARRPGVIGLAGAPAPRSATPTSVRAIVGQPTSEHLALASTIIDRLRGPLTEAMREPFGAWAAVYAAILSNDAKVRAAQLAGVSQGPERFVSAEVDRLARSAADLPSPERFAIFELAAPALRRMTREQYQVFKSGLERLALADDELSLFEWAAGRALGRLLEANFTDARPTRVRYYSLTRLGSPCSALLSALAYVGARTQADAERAFRAAAAELPDVSGLELLPPGRVTPTDLDGALDELAAVAPKCKSALIQGACRAIASDQNITPREYELLRAIAAALDCPMPPLLPGQSVRA